VESEINNEPVSEEVIKPKSFFSRLGGTYLSPRETFLEIGRAPSVLAPIIAMVVIGFLASFYLARTLDLSAVVTAQLEKMVQQGNLTQEQLDQYLPRAVQMAGIQLVVAGSLGSLIIALIIAGYAKLFSLFVGAINKFKPIFVAALYAMMAVTIVSSILLIVILQIKGPGNITDLNSMLASNLGAILESILGVDALPKFLLSLAKAVDVFNIWMIALLSIGFSAVSQKLKTATAAIWLSSAYLIFFLIQAAIQLVFKR
jgi:hypothetical protein